MTEVLHSAVLGVIVLGGVWLYGSLLEARFKASGIASFERIAKRFRYAAALLIIVAFVVGTMYRLHVIDFNVAIMLYIPIGIGFLVFIGWLQPYLHFHKEDSDHE